MISIRVRIKGGTYILDLLIYSKKYTTITSSIIHKEKINNQIKKLKSIIYNNITMNLSPEIIENIEMYHLIWGLINDTCNKVRGKNQKV